MATKPPAFIVEVENGKYFSPSLKDKRPSSRRAVFDNLFARNWKSATLLRRNGSQTKVRFTLTGPKITDEPETKPKVQALKVPKKRKTKSTRTKTRRMTQRRLDSGTGIFG